MELELIEMMLESHTSLAVSRKQLKLWLTRIWTMSMLEFQELIHILIRQLSWLMEKIISLLKMDKLQLCNHFQVLELSDLDLNSFNNGIPKKMLLY